MSALFPGLDASEKRDVRTIPFKSQKFVIVDGAAAATNIAITDIKLIDDIVAALNLTDLVTCSQMPTVTSAGNIRFASLSTATKKLLIVYVVN